MAAIVPVVTRAIESLALCLQQESAFLFVHRQEIEILLAELKLTKIFLSAPMEQEGKPGEIRGLDLFFVREVAYEVIDFADDLIYELMSKNAGDGGESLLSYLDSKFKEMQARFTFSREIGSLTARIREINARLEGHVGRDAILQCMEESKFIVNTDLWMTLRESSSPLVDDFFIGMEDEKEKLLSLLVNEEKENYNIRIIGVFGIGGIGKTTLAKKVYEDCRVRDHFDGFAWAAVGHDLKPREIMKSLLLQLCVVGSREELLPLSDLDLAQRLFEFQLSRKYLIVLDDIWNDAWECLRIAFPLKQTGSRVLLTTRCREATKSIAVEKGVILQMRCLNQEEGCELLQKIAFRADYLDLEVDQDLLEIGKDIARRCQGLPLAVKVVGGLLGARRTADEWKKVLQNLDTKMTHQSEDLYLNNCKGFEETNIIVSSSLLAYNALPHNLKQCILYLGMFPEGAEIEAEKLYLLWCAEGMISYRDGENKVTMMDIAEGYLYELAIRSMVLVQEEKFPNSRRFRSCRLHDLIRELCLLKQKEEEFFDVVYFRRANHFGIHQHAPFSSLEIPRVALYFEDACAVPIDWNADKSKYSWSMLLKNMCQHFPKLNLLPGCSPHRDLTRLRVLCFSAFNVEVLRLLPARGKLTPLQFLNLRDLPQVFSDLNDLRRLRVLDISGFNFKVTKLPQGIEKLSRLRYLGLSNCNIAQLPLSICSLFNLETLYLRDCPEMIIPNELQKLRKLKYLYLPRIFKVYGVHKLHLDTFRDLETLVNFDSRVCEVKDLFKLTKLHKLAASIDNNLEDLEAMIHCINMNLSNLRLSSLLLRNPHRCSREETFISSNLFESLNIHGLHVEGYIGKLPQNVSQSLTKITFIGSKLEEDPIQTLEELPNLWSLVLRNNAYLGNHMMCSSSGMPRLKHLTLSNLQKVETLTVEKGGMPKLCTLSIEKCPLMKQPGGLSSHTNLQKLRLTCMAPSFQSKLHCQGKSSCKVS